MAFTSELGTDLSQLGDIVLGLEGDVTNNSATDTLSITESAKHNLTRDVVTADTITFTEASDAGKVYTVSTDDSISLTEANFGNTVLSGSVSETISFTDSASRTSSFAETATDTITFTDECRSSDIFTVSTSDFWFMTEETVGGLTLQGLTSDTLVITEVAAGTINLFNTADTIFWIESASGSNPLSPIASDLITFSEIVNDNIIPGHPADDKLTFTDYALVQTSLGRSNLETLNFTESAERGPTSRAVFADDSMTITESPEGFIMRIGKDTITFTDDVESDLTKGVTDTLAFTEEATGQGRQVLSDSIVFVESSKGNKTRFVRVDELFILADSTEGSFQHIAAVAETITFTEAVVKSRYIRNNSEAISFADVATNSPSYKRPASDTLALTESATCTRSWARVATDSLALSETKFDPSAGVFVGAVTGVLLAPQILFRGPAGSLVLPQPEFGDGENTTNEFSLRFSQTGIAYTIIRRRRNNRRLTLVFNVKRIKEKELVQYFSIQNDQYLELFNWKGEQWRVKLLSNPIQSNNIGFDRFRVELEFEGIQLSSGGVNTCLC